MEYKNVGKIKEFTDLKAWQAAYKLSLSVYLSSKQFPREELFGLTSQVRRSSVSVASNIAEGFGRNTFKEKAHFYFQARGSLVETKSHVLIARGLKYLSLEQYESLATDVSEAQALLQGLLRSTREKIGSNRAS